jgi:hypothetical protein
MHVYYFFSSNSKTNGPQDSAALATPVPHRDQPPPKARVIVAKPATTLQNPDFLYLRTAPYSLSLKTQQNIYEIATYTSPI